MNRITRLFVPGLIVGLVLGVPFTAFADGIDSPTAPITPKDTLASVHLSALVVSALVALILPVVVGVVTKSASKYKGPFLMALTAATALLTNSQLGDGSAVIGQQSLLIFMGSLGAAVVAYVTIWRPLGLTSSTTSKVVVDAQGTETLQVAPGKLASGGIL